jgi:hypothetical protein
LNDGIYTLHTVIWEFDQDTPLTVRTFDNHDLGVPDQLLTHDGVTVTLYEFTEDTVVFARFSETEYRIFRGSDIIYYSDWPCICFFSTIPSQDGDGLEVTVILVCQMLWDTMTDGNADESTTYFFDPEGFGWADGDLIIE